MRSILLRIVHLILVPTWLIGLFGNGHALAERIIISDIAVIPMDRDGILPGQDVVVAEGRIVAIRPHGSAPADPDDTIIIGEGRYLMPGLWDMHVHVSIPYADNEVSAAQMTDIILPRFTGYGIVGVRDTGSTLADFSAVRAALQDRPTMPHFYASGPLFEGPQMRWSKAVAVHATNAAQGRALAEQLADAGVDFFKIYDTLPEEALHAIAEVAEERGLPIAGHIPFSLSTGQVLDAGLRLIEHVYPDLVADCSPFGADARLEPLTAWIEDGLAGKYRATLALWQSRHPPSCALIFSDMARRGVFVTPMLHMEVPHHFVVPDEALPGVMAQARESCAVSRTAAAEVSPELATAMRDELYGIVRALDVAGVRLLAGSDNGGDCRSDGYSLHRELQLLVDAGISPQNALRMATLNAAAARGDDSAGRIAVGAPADLLILDANPLDDIANSLQIATLIRGGHIVPGPDLERMRALDLPVE